MLVWRGWGLLTLVIAAVAAGFGSAVMTSSKLQAYGAAGGLFLGAVVNWFLGQSLNRPLREADFDHGRRHSLFWIPTAWWSLAMVAGAAVAALGMVR